MQCIANYVDLFSGTVFLQYEYSYVIWSDVGGFYVAVSQRWKHYCLIFVSYHKAQRQIG